MSAQTPLTLDDVQILLRGLLGGWPVVGWIDSGHIGVAARHTDFWWTGDIPWALRVVQRELHAGTRFALTTRRCPRKLIDVNAARTENGLPILEVHRFVSGGSA